MITRIYNLNWRLYFWVPVIIFFSCYCITLTTVFKINQHIISYGIIIDLLITAPLVYLFLIRNKPIAKFTVLRVVLLGIIASGFMLNTESNQLMSILKQWVVPMIEAIIFSIIIRKFYLANKTTKTLNNGSIDFLTHSRVLLTQTFGNAKIAAVIATEASMFYYAFFSKKNKKSSEDLCFTSYKESAIIAIFYALMMAIVVETLALHFLLMLVSPILAWILTGLSLYTCIQLFAHIRAITSRVIKINNNILELRMGLAADAEIHLSNIKSIEIISKESIEKDVVKISLLQKLEPQNMMIELYESVEITKLYGIKRYSKRISFFVDEPIICYEKLKTLIA